MPRGPVKAQIYNIHSVKNSVFSLKDFKAVNEQSNNYILVYKHHNMILSLFYFIAYYTMYYFHVFF